MSEQRCDIGSVAAQMKRAVEESLSQSVDAI